MTLRPSISRQEYGTLSEWIECIETFVVGRRGSLGKGQQEWIDTFASIPPAESDIDLNVKSALRECAA